MLEPVPFAVILVLTALGAVVRPRFGPAHCAVLLVAMAGDQTRVQPELVSLAVLMTAPAFGSAGRQFARWVLATMWLWAGVHKALSLGWPDVEPARIAADLGWSAIKRPAAIGVPLIEVAMGLGALWRRSWPVARWGGVATHIGILLVLSPLFGNRNSAVWPWNLALAVAAFFLFAPREVPWPGARKLVGAVVLAGLLVYPAAFYWNGGNAYLSHHLYSSSVPVALVCQGEQCSANPFPTGSLRVPFPPEPRLFKQRFDETCRTGEVLRIVRPETRITPERVEEHTCPD